MRASGDDWEIVTVCAAGEAIRYRQAPAGCGPEDAWPFREDGRYPAGVTGLAVIPNGPVCIGTGRSGLFHYECSASDPCFDEALADFLRYEHSYGRVPILFDLDAAGGCAGVAEALARTPLPNVVRSSDPRYFVHSTSRAAGDQIRQDGAIKSWNFLEQEGRPPCWHKLKSAVLGEPAEYAHYVNLGSPGNPWTEVVTASHQAGKFLGPDDCYEPGWRFYFDAHRLIEAGRITRQFGCKAHRLLPLEPFCVGQIDLSAVEAGQTAPWTPRRFAELADRAFGCE